MARLLSLLALAICIALFANASSIGIAWSVAAGEMLGYAAMGAMVIFALRQYRAASPQT